MTRKLFSILILVVFIAVFNGCGFGGGGTTPDPEPEGPELYFPLSVGTSWTYRVTEPDSTGADTTYVQTKNITNTLQFEIDSATTYNPPFNQNILWFRQEDKESTYYQDDGDFIWMGEIIQDLVDFGYDGFVPIRAVPIHYEEYDSFATIINKGSGAFSAEIIFSVKVVDTLEDIETEIGTFYDCLRIEAFLQDSSLMGKNTTSSSIWFADSIGEVKRHDHTVTGTSKTYYEELIDYSID